MKNPSSLPRLAFGNSVARESRDLEAFAAAQRCVMPAIGRYEPCEPRGGFHHRAATLRLGDLRLVASASTPVSVTVGDSDDTTLLIPLHGWGTSVIGGREYRWKAGEAAMFLFGNGREGRSGVRSVLGISFDPRRLAATARAMLGPRGGGRLDLDLRTPRLIPLHASWSPAAAMLRQILPVIDLAGHDDSALRLIGLDDMLYRLIAVLLAPEPLRSAFAAHGAGLATAEAVGRATEHILAHASGPITLSDLERVSGLSTRSLQVAFRRVHGCSPQAWIRERRLALARERLQNPSPADRVTTISLACGFTRLGSFAAAYAARFGEAPSKTLARSRG